MDGKVNAACSSGRSVACIGAGNVGRSWAIVFARAGHNVRLYDADPSAVVDRALPAIAQSLRDMQAGGLIDRDANISTRIRAAGSLSDAVDGAFYVQESVREDLETKQTVFKALGTCAADDAILASSTSAIPGSQFLHVARHPQRCIIAHPVNPPHLIPLVEVCPAPSTTTATTDRCLALMRELGQQPICVRKEIPGFVLNRLQFTLVGEALHLVGEGYCTAEDIDNVIKHGLAMRWAFMGPFEVGHLNASDGFQGFVDQLGDMMRELASDAKPDYDWSADLARQIHEPLAQKHPIDGIPQRQAWRDRRIMALRKHLQQAARTLGD